MITALLLMGFAILYLTSRSTVENRIAPNNLSIELIDAEYSDIDAFVPGVEIPISPKGNNIGNVSSYVFIELRVPFGVADDGERVEYFQYEPSSSWFQVHEDVEEDQVLHVFAYGNDGNLVAVEPGEKTDALFEDGNIIVGNIGLLPEDQRIERNLKIDALGIQTQVGNEGLDAAQIYQKLLESERARGGL